MYIWFESPDHIHHVGYKASASLQQTDIISGTIRITCGLIGRVQQVCWLRAKKKKKSHYKDRLEKVSDRQYVHAVC